MRRRTLGLALSGILAPSLSYALGLGEIAANSALNQPLDAHIELVSTSASEVPSVTVHLAPNAVFDQVGIERSGILDSLSFQPTVVNGVPVIKVTSSTPIQEPFLNFVIEVAWPKGKLLREYTVLLDPPVFGGASTTAAVQPSATQPVFTDPAPVVSAATDAGVAPVETGLPPFISSSQIDSFSMTDAGTTVETFPVAEVEDTLDTMPMAQTFPVEESGSFDSLPVDVDLETFAVTDSGAVEELETFQEFSGSAEIETFTVTESGSQGEFIPFDQVEGSSEIFVTPPARGFVAQTFDEVEPMEAPTFASSDRYEVNRGDTLFGIARNTRPSDGVSMNQMMAGFLQENPNAFINNNINLLKSGFILRVPDDSVLSGISGTQAKEMLVAGGAWKEYRAKMAQTPVPQQQVSSTAGIGDLDSGSRDRVAQEVETTASAETAPTSLEILTPDAGKGSSAQGSDASNSKLLAANDALKEQLQSKTEEAAELRSRVSELEALVEAKVRLIELKDEQLSDLQTKLAGADKMAADAAKAGADAPGLLDKVSEPPAETVTEITEAQPEIVSEPMAAVEPGVEDDAQSETPAAAVEDGKPNPQMLMGAGVGALLLAMLAWLVFRRKDKSEEVLDSMPDDQVTTVISETHESTSDIGADLDTVGFDEPMDGPPSLMMDKDELDLPDETRELNLDELDDLDIHDDLTAVEASEGGEDEVLSEANVYLAYGLHDQAVDLLKPAVASHPNRIDYLAKLVEAHHAAGDQAAFVTDAENLHGQIGPEEEGLWQRTVVMGKDIAPEHSLFVNADPGDLSLTSIQRQRPALDDIDLDDMPDSGNAPETLVLDESDYETFDEDEVDPAGEFRLPELDELSQSLQMEEDEAITELKRGQADLSQEIDPATLGALGAGLAGVTAPVSSADDKTESLSYPADDDFDDLSEHALDINLDDDPNMSLADMEEELADLSTGADEINTKLDLAKAYLDMGDHEGAREALDEVIAQGDDSQRGEAKKLMDQLG